LEAELEREITTVASMALHIRRVEKLLAQSQKRRK
jgi:hypothetical protein